MAESAQYEELVRQFSAFGAVKREMNRLMPSDCPSGSAAVLTVLGRDGDMRMSRLAELLSVDMSVTSRHVAHLAERGWIERSPDPADKRSRILRLTPALAGPGSTSCSGSRHSFSPSGCATGRTKRSAASHS